MEKVVVTGATGYIGSHLVIALRERGFDVIEMGREFYPVECDRVYHLGCPSSSQFINANPTGVMDIIIDQTRAALNICPSALFINASSVGVLDLDDPSEQGAYNIAKRCMEVYLEHSSVKHINYRIPLVYGVDMRNEGLLSRAVKGTATPPLEPNKAYQIEHIDRIIDILVELKAMAYEDTTLGKIYEDFSSGRRGLHRSASSTHVTTRQTK